MSLQRTTLICAAMLWALVGCEGDSGSGADASWYHTDESHYEENASADHSVPKQDPNASSRSEILLSDEIRITDRPLVTTEQSHYVSNRAPLAPSRLIKLPVGSIKPKGWVLEYIKRQKEGLTGNLGSISAWLNKDNNAWLSSSGEGERGWEEVPYWLRGYSSIAYALNDEAMLAETELWINAALSSQRTNGDFGPDKRFDDGTRDYWANMVMLFNLQSWYEHAGDQRVIELMTRYFGYLARVPDEEFLTHYWQRMRGGDMLYSVFWLYNRTGNESLLEFAHKIHRNTADWSRFGHLPDLHNVNIAQGFREPATYYLLSGNQEHLLASYDNLNHIRTRFGQVPGGMWGGDEISRDGYDDPHQAIETCGIVEQLFSNEMMLWITGDPFWADHAEEVAFNSAPAATMPDFRGLRYLTSPNHIVSDAEDHSPGLNNSGPFLLLSALSSRCCQHNHSQGWPYYSENLWMATPDRGLALVLLSASDVSAKVGVDDAQVSLSVVGNYPFEETLTVTINTQERAEFPLYLRVPAWSSRTALRLLEDEVVLGAAAAGRYVRIDRVWHDGDQVILEMPMELNVRRWSENHNSASVEFGPLTFSLKIEEEYIQRDPTDTAIWDSEWQETIDLEDWPAYEIQPASDWNYGLVLDSPIHEIFRVEWRDWPSNDFPFDHAGVPISIFARAKQIPNWVISEHGLAGALQDSPIRSNAEEEEVELIPMGAARLRISAFPVIGTGPDANEWQ